MEYLKKLLNSIVSNNDHPMKALGTDSTTSGIKSVSLCSNSLFFSIFNLLSPKKTLKNILAV